MNAGVPTKESVKELLDYLGNRLFHIENYYLIYCELGLHYNKAVNEDSSKAYLKVINGHKGFFMPVQESLRATLTVELCSFIVKKERKYKSLGKAIDELKQLPNAPDLNSKYDNLLTSHANIISHLEKFRNQYYAHKSFADLLKLPKSSDKEFQELFKDIKDLMNEAHAYFGNTIWFMDDDARESIKDTHDMMDNLLRGESQRLSEIDVEYISEVYRDGKKRWLSQS
ncbi:hypothetical protein KDA06_02200 [Candidatus Saccharibacteria bacterium]|nr:hypothetical protein [Candidatus Saccharibacteria bacterium]